MSVMLCSLNELKSHLLIPITESLIDSELTSAINAASDEAERDNGRRFTYTGYSNEPYDAKERGELALRNYPVDPNAAFQLKDQNPWGEIWIWDPSDYSVDYERGIVHMAVGLMLSSGYGSTLVTYSAGYALTGIGNDQKVGVPDSLDRDVRDYASAIYREQKGAISAKDLEDVKKNVSARWRRYARVW